MTSLTSDLDVSEVEMSAERGTVPALVPEAVSAVGRPQLVPGQQSSQQVGVSAAEPALSGRQSTHPATRGAGHRQRPPGRREGDWRQSREVSGAVTVGVRRQGTRRWEAGRVRGNAGMAVSWVL